MLRFHALMLVLLSTAALPLFDQLAQQGRPQSEAPKIKYVLASSPEGRPLYPDHNRNFAPRRAGESGQRNRLRGDGYLSVDAGLAKRLNMPYNERHSVQFRWEVFNVSNSTRFDVNSLTIDLGPRQMQFGLRYEF